MNEQRRGVAEMTAAMVISGSIGWFVLVSGEPVLAVVFWRCAFAVVALVPLCWAQGAFQVRLDWRQIALAVGGGVAIVLNWVLLFAAYGHASVSVATVAYNAQPFILLGFGAAFLGERVTGVKIGWLALAFAGMAAIALTRTTAPYAGGDHHLGILLALAASLGWAIAALTARKLKGMPPQLIALIHVSVGAVMLAPFALALPAPVSAQSWALLAAMGIVHTGIMYALMYAAVQKLPTHLQGGLSFIYPVVAVIVDVAALGHAPGAVQFLGMAAILLAAGGLVLGWTPWRTAREAPAAKRAAA
jgi:drug/metabolite transporter (DMT)-like permease